MLREAATSSQAELVAVYGRRRVGKTFLIREVYAEQIVFELVGTHEGRMDRQLRAFAQALQVMEEAPMAFATPEDWMSALQTLSRALEPRLRRARKKLVVFFDELPWLATVFAGGSSKNAFGIVETQASTGEVREEGRFGVCPGWLMADTELVYSLTESIEKHHQYVFEDPHDLQDVASELAMIEATVPDSDYWKAMAGLDREIQIEVAKLEEAMNQLGNLPEAVNRELFYIFRVAWAPFACVWLPLGCPWAPFGRPRTALGSPWASFGRPWAPSGCLGLFRVLLGVSGALLGVLGDPRAPQEMWLK